MVSKIKLLRDIRRFCLECSNGSYIEVKECVISKCILYPYRFGKDPESLTKELNHKNDAKKDSMR